MTVSEMTAADWEVILATAAAVLTCTDGLEASIRQRQHVALFLDREHRAVGLTTYDFLVESFEGRVVVSLFTGNAWLHPRWRSAGLPQMLAARLVWVGRRRWPSRPLFWFFGSNSFQSYLAMARNMRVFWPNPDAATPPWEGALIAHLARHFYGGDGLTDDGLLWRPSGRGRAFASEDTTVGDALQSDACVRHFVQLNPGYVDGNKLMCLAPLTAANLAVAARQAVVKTARAALGGGGRRGVTSQ